MRIILSRLPNSVLVRGQDQSPLQLEGCSSPLEGCGPLQFDEGNNSVNAGSPLAPNALEPDASHFEAGGFAQD